MTAHARLSASSAGRWLVCPGGVGGGKPSQYAAEGTYAHEIAARCIKVGYSPKKFLGAAAKIDGFVVVCDQEMVDGINLYVEAVCADERDGDEMLTEVSLIDALQKIDPDLGGTADHIRYRESDKSLHVFDFKYGKGVYVEAEENEQLRMYALGAILKVGKPVVKVEVTVVQPRYESADPIRTWTFKGMDILDFIADVQDAAAKTRLPDAEKVLVAGDHCKFCPKASTCPELEKRHHSLVAAEFNATEVFDPARLSAALASIPLVKARIKAIEEFAYEAALKGEEIPGYKLVDKRPTRKWKSQGDVIEWAEGQEIDPYAPRELLSPAQLEARLADKDGARGSKARAKETISQFVESVSSGKALVPATDNRAPAKQVTAEDFDISR